MKGKIPTLKQKKILMENGKDLRDWLVTKNPIGKMFIIHRETGEKDEFTY